jgi:hypothetical protein
MTIGPAPMMRMVDMSVRLGIKSRTENWAQKKGARAARPLSKSAIFARGVSLDQISGVGKDYKRFINRRFPVRRRKKVLSGLSVPPVEATPGQGRKQIGCCSAADPLCRAGARVLC